MRVLTTLSALVFATATLGGCAARAGVRVGHRASTTTATSTRVADKNVKAEGQGSAEAAAAETPAVKSETTTDAKEVQADN